MNKKVIYIQDGNRVSLKRIKRTIKDTALVESLGEYIESREIIKLTGINSSTLYNWRRSGKIHAKQIDKLWYYSKSELLKLLKP
jgi:transposase-like protein